MIRKLSILLSTLFVPALSATALHAAGPMDGLTEIVNARSGRVGSASPLRSSNSDNRHIPAGATFTLAELKGPGLVTHIWLTFPDARPGWLGENGNPTPDDLVIRCYWDDSETPAVEAPLGDFFAAGFGKRAEVFSMPVLVEGGDAYNCYWPMPFGKSARITLENQNPTLSLNAFYYQIDFETCPEFDPKTPYFCAQYRQAFPCESGKDYLILDAEGHGHYVGTVLTVRSRSPEWFGEGDEKFYIDGETHPSIQGTGTEDYVGNAWGMGKGTFPWFGVPILEGDWGMVGYSTSVYRWHVPDPVRFTKSLRAEIEDAGWISEDEWDGKEYRGFVERNDDFATVAFWYQVGQPKRFTQLPTRDERKFPSIDWQIIEGKDLLAGVGSQFREQLSLQKGWDWTGDGQLFFSGRSTESKDISGSDTSGPGAMFTCTFMVEKEELSQLTLRATSAPDFGKYEVLLDGESIRTIDFYADDIKVLEYDLGQRTLSATPATHTITFRCIGKSGESSDYRLGIDSLRMRQRWHIQRSTPADL